MGTVVYSNLLELLLEERDMTRDEIVQEATERFGFPEGVVPDIKLQLGMKKTFGHIEEDANGKYHQLRGFGDDDSLLGRRRFVKSLQEAPREYMEEKPWLIKLKEALEVKLGGMEK